MLMHCCGNWAPWLFFDSSNEWDFSFSFSFRVWQLLCELRKMRPTVWGGRQSSSVLHPHRSLEKTEGIKTFWQGEKLSLTSFFQKDNPPLTYIPWQCLPTWHTEGAKLSPDRGRLYLQSVIRLRGFRLKVGWQIFWKQMELMLLFWVDLCEDWCDKTLLKLLKWL